MKDVRRCLRVFLLSVVFFNIPGASVWQAAASMIAAPVPLSSAQAGAWGSALSGLALSVKTQPGLSAQFPALSPVLGRLRLELMMHPRNEDAMVFRAHLPAEFSEAKAFSGLDEAEQVRLMGEAVSAVSGELEPKVQALLSRTQGKEPGEQEMSRLEEAGRYWFYLQPETARALKGIVGEFRSEETLGLARTIAGILLGSGVEDRDKVVASELDALFQGAAVLVRQGGKDLDADGFVQTRLAPYSRQALAESEKRAQERGVPAGEVSAALIEKHVPVFGKIADRGLFKTLRAKGLWTEFVSALSLQAVDSVLQETGSSALASKMLSSAAQGDDLMLRIPSWHPLSSSYRTIAQWLSARFGPADDSDKLPGRPFGHIAGIPIRVGANLLIVLGVGGWLLKSAFDLALDDPMFRFAAGLASALLVLGTIFGHELGHASAAKLFGIPTRSILVDGVTGKADVARGFRQALPEFVVALAGPLTSALFAAVGLIGAAMIQEPVLAMMFKIVGKLNAYYAGTAMIPVFPFDGARALRAALTKPLGGYRATQVAAWLSFGIALASMAYGLYMIPVSQFGGAFSAALSGYFAAVSLQSAVHPGTEVDAADDRLPHRVH
jgi:Zn-dependent protease